MKWDLIFEPWNIRACDMADVMHRIESAFKTPNGVRTYIAGTDKNSDNICIHYCNGDMLMLFQDIYYEDIPQILAMLSPYDIRLKEAYNEIDDGKEFDCYEIQHEFFRIVDTAKNLFRTNTEEIECYRIAWQEFCERNGLSDEVSDEEGEDEVA